MAGFFLTLEGGEGAGKTTISTCLQEDLAKLLPEVLTTREPGYGPLGKAIRHMILDSEDIDVTPKVEALLFAADRVQHVEDYIRPALDRGAVVICDRYIDSSIAYQGYARGLGADSIADLSLWGTDGLIPNLTILIDLDPTVGISRKHGQEETNKMEKLDLSFHETVRNAFLDIASVDTERIIIIDGNEDKETVYQNVLSAVKTALGL